MRLFLACVIVFVLSFCAFPVFAQKQSQLSEPTGGQVNEALNKIVPIRFLPNHPLYFSIKFKEVVLRFFKPSAVKRAEYDFILASKRIKESYFVYKNGDLKYLSASLMSYSKRVDITIGQIKKARSQNQEISMLAEKIVEGLESQEVLLRYLKINEAESENFKNLDGAITSFGNLVDVVDNVKPGIIDRYKILNDEGNKQNEASTSSSQKPYEITEATKSVMPRRIIF